VAGREKENQIKGEGRERMGWIMSEKEEVKE
jgi:hypothetical protein